MIKYVWIGAMALACAGCGTKNAEPESRSAVIRQNLDTTACAHPTTAGEECTEFGERLAVPLPPATSATDVTLVATDILTLAAGAAVNGHIANMGKTQTMLGSAATSGDIWSSAFTILGSAVKVNGNVSTESTVLRDSSVVISGAVTENIQNVAPRSIGWWSTFPKNNSGDVIASSGAKLELAPGSYRTLDVQAGAIVTMQGGKYTFESFRVRTGGLVKWSANTIPTMIHVQSSLGLQGSLERSPDSKLGLFVSYSGTGEIVLSKPFRGTLAAPKAFIRVGYTVEPHRGAFFGKHVELAAGAVVNHEAFEWNNLRDEENKEIGDPPNDNISTTNGPPPKLSVAGDVKPFLDWFCMSTVSDLISARASVDAVKGNADIAKELIAQFGKSRAMDITRSDLTLQVLGYLRSPEGEAFFTALLAEPLPRTGIKLAKGGIFEQRRSERYFMRATQGLGFMNTESARAKLRSVMSAHDSRVVRSEAVRAYLYNNPAADKDQLATMLRSEEKALVDRIEDKNRDLSTTFDQKLDAYLAKHPWTGEQ